MRSVDEALQNYGAVADALQRARRYGEVVAHEVELGDLRLLREVQLVWVRDANLMSVERQDLGIVRFRHGISLHPPPYLLAKVFKGLGLGGAYHRKVFNGLGLGTKSSSCLGSDLVGPISPLFVF